jgi:hypothetical protein
LLRIAPEPAILLEVAGGMRHHPENIGVAVLAEDFACSVAGIGGIAIVDAGHDFFIP